MTESAPHGLSASPPVRALRRGLAFGLDWKNLLGTIVCLGVLAWLIRAQGAEAWKAIASAHPRPLVGALALVLLNMLVRALRWQVLLGRVAGAGYLRIFSALMIGYLANNILPARGGDLVRVLVLGAHRTITRSRILASVVVERVLDMAAIVLVFGVASTESSLPEWIRQGGAFLAAGAAAGIVGLIVIGWGGQRPIDFLLRPVQKRVPSLSGRLRSMAVEFAAGIGRFRRLDVGFAFVVLTGTIWATEIGIIVLVASAFGFHLSAIDSVVLMFFSLFSSLLPALPGQIGTFELATVMALEFSGHVKGTNLIYAMALHIVTLGGTSVIGAVCLMLSGGTLVPSAATEAPSRTSSDEARTLATPPGACATAAKQAEGTPRA